MTKRDKQTMEKGFLALNKVLGEKRAAFFVAQILKEGLDYDGLKNLSDELEAERRKAAEELQKQAEERRQERQKRAREFTKDDFNDVMQQYAGYLNERKIEFDDHQGFTVWREADENISPYQIHITHDFSEGKIMVWTYFGRAMTSLVRPVNNYLKELKNSYPDYDFDVETFHNYSHEFTISREFYYTTLDELHEQVVKEGDICQAVVKLGRETFGDNFEK